MAIAIVLGLRPHLLTSKKHFTDPRKYGELINKRKCSEI